MADRVFSIDFGSSFTKVCLRPAASGTTVPMSIDRLRDNLRMCIPSTVLIGRATGEPLATCGPRAAERRPGPEIEVHTNWKKRVFADPDPPPGPLVPPAPPAPPAARLDALLRSDELRALAAGFQVPPTQLARLRQLVACACALAEPPADPTPPPGPAGTPVGPIAVAYFKWLRSAMLDVCQRKGVPNADDIPARLSVPAFDRATAPDSAAARRLRRWAEQAGWALHPDQGLVSEPYANMIGVLTGGANVVQKTGRLHIGKMFSNGPLVTVVKDPTYHPSYRAVVVDVGAYTTDLATLTLNTRGQTVDDPDAQFVVGGRSVPVGVSDLDERVLDALSADARRYLERQSQVSWNDFQQTVYTDAKPYQTAELGEIGGGPTAADVRQCVADFARRLVEQLTEFCRPLEPVHLQEVILTGGGNNIPAVREALAQAAKAACAPLFKIHWPGRTTRQTDPPVQKVDELHVRGGSAVGGASVYFDRAFW